MVATTVHTPTQLQTILVSYSQSILSKEEMLDAFLDHINENREKLASYTLKINHLSQLLKQITWIDNLSGQDEIIVQGLLTMSKQVDKLLHKVHQDFRKKYSKHDKNILKIELQNFDTAIKFHAETIKEIEYIIFVLRKNKDFLDLCNLLDEV